MYMYKPLEWTRTKITSTNYLKSNMSMVETYTIPIFALSQMIFLTNWPNFRLLSATSLHTILT